MKWKYGLIHNPSYNEIKQWIIKVEYYISNGFKLEAAGKCAAIVIFKDYGKVRYNPGNYSFNKLIELAKKV